MKTFVPVMTGELYPCFGMEDCQRMFFPLLRFHDVAMPRAEDVPLELLPRNAFDATLS